jgi:hypothetical protein
MTSELLAVDAEIAAKDNNGWFPIETAPKDGAFDVFTKHGRIVNCVKCVQFGHIYSYSEEMAGYIKKVNGATHWQPQPQPPKEG